VTNWQVSKPPNNLSLQNQTKQTKGYKALKSGQKKIVLVQQQEKKQ